MFTTYPLATVDTLNSHVGFYIVVIVVIFISLITCANLDDRDNWEDYKSWIIVAMISIAISAGISWNTGEIKTYANIPVTATFVGYQPETYTTQERQGKHTNTVIHHRIYVVYRIDGTEELTIFETVSGAPTVKHAQLYKN